VKTIGGVILAAIGAGVVAFIVDVVLAFRIAAHDSNMTVPTANHIVQITFLVVFAIGILMLILRRTGKGESRSYRTSNSAARTNNRTSNRAAPTSRTEGTVRACGCGGGQVTCPSCGGRGWHIGNSGKYDQSCVTCGTRGKVTCGRCRGTGKIS
jgi:hypothetical protein